MTMDSDYKEVVYSGGPFLFQYMDHYLFYFVEEGIVHEYDTHFQIKKWKTQVMHNEALLTFLRLTGMTRKELVKHFQAEALMLYAEKPDAEIFQGWIYEIPQPR